MSIGLIRCYECKAQRANRRGIMYTRKCSDGKNHKVCYDCIWDIALKILKEYNT